MFAKKGLLELSVLLLLLICLACSGGGGSDDSSFAGLLKVIPDTPETRKEVWMIDIAHIREQFGIAILPSDADEKALGDYLHAIAFKGGSDPSDGQTGFAHAPFISGLTIGLHSLNRWHYLGFDVRNVDQTVLVPRPSIPLWRSEPLEIVRGRFDSGTTQEAMSECNEPLLGHPAPVTVGEMLTGYTGCEAPDRVRSRGINYYSWGDDNDIDPEKPFAPPAFDRGGRGGRIAVVDDYVLRTIETAGMESLIDTQKGLRDSLAENEEFKLLAKAMDSMDAYAIYLSDDTQSWQVDNILEKLLLEGNYSENLEIVSERFRETMSKGGLLHPYNALATGVGQDERGLFMAVALVYDDSDDAREDIQILERRVQDGESIRFRGRFWADFFSNVELRSEGRVLLGKLRTERPGMWSGIIEPTTALSHDSLFIHE